MIILTILGWFLILLGAAGAAYTLLAAYCAGRFARTPVRTATVFPAVTILKPLHGGEPALEDNLETFFVQDYPGPVQIVFGVDSADDQAIAVVERLRARHPDADTALTIEARRHGSNPKVSNLVNMMEAARHGVLVHSDSDIAVEPDYLNAVVGALEPEDVGAATCPYTGWAAGGFASRLSAMGINYLFLTNVLTGTALGLTEPCFGSTIALKRAVLEEIGGFKAFADVLADDFEIGRAVRESGRRVVIDRTVVRHACHETGLGEWFDHELRWMRTIRTMQPAGHAGSIVTHTFPLALIGTILSAFSWISLAVLAASFAARAVLKWRIDGLFGGAAGPLWLLPLRDVLSFAAFAASLFGASVVWQKERLTVEGDGALSQRVR
jgi:ceramide glucosyltransferase